MQVEVERGREGMRAVGLMVGTGCWRGLDLDVNRGDDSVVNRLNL